MTKKAINDPERIVDEVIEGIVFASHGRLRDGQRAELPQGDLRSPLGEESNSSVEEERGQDRERLDPLPERRSDDCGREQKQDDEAPELPENQSPERRFSGAALQTSAPREKRPTLRERFPLLRKSHPLRPMGTGARDMADGALLSRNAARACNPDGRR